MCTDLVYNKINFYSMLFRARFLACYLFAVARWLIATDLHSANLGSNSAGTHTSWQEGHRAKIAPVHQ